MIKAAEFDFPSPYWDDVSDLVKELIKSLLVVDPGSRLDAQQILDHPWVSGASTPRKELPNVLEKIRDFNAKRKFKRAGYMVMASIRFKNIFKRQMIFR